MEVTYFTGIDGMEPKSMTLTKNLLFDCIKNHIQIKECTKPKENLPPFFERYVRYPVYGRKYISQFNHITDQTNCGIMAFSRGEKFIVTVHDIYPVAYPIPGNSFYLHLSIPFLKKADKLIAVSKFTKSELVKYQITDEEKIKVIYNIADDSFKPNKKIRVVGDRKTILYIGSSNEPRKNLDTLIKAFSICQKSVDSALVLVINDLSIMRLVDELKLRENVMLFRDLSTSSLCELYNQADLFVFPSYYEGFGLPILEAISCGLPVIAYKCSSIPEVCGDAALLLNPDSVFDPYVLSENIAKVLMDNKLSKKMSNASLRQAKKFSKEQYRKEILSVYNEVFV